MTDGLRDRLIGAWKRLSYQKIPVDRSDPSEPLGNEPRGLIFYTPDRYMSAQLSKPDRPNFTSGDWFARRGQCTAVILQPPPDPWQTGTYTSRQLYA